MSLSDPLPTAVWRGATGDARVAAYAAPDAVTSGALWSTGASVLLPPGVAAVGVEVRDPARTVAALRGVVAPVPGGPGEGAVVARRAEFLAGRWCAERALAAVGGPGRVGRDGDGAPVWPAGYVGSITHSHGRVLAVAARAAHVAALGVDAERWVSAPVAAELGSQVLAAAELALLADAVGDGARAFTVGFSAKEALYKCLHPTARRFMDFDAARVVRADRGALTLELACAWAPALPAGRRFTARYASTADGVETLVAAGAGAAW